MRGRGSGQGPAAWRTAWRTAGRTLGSEWGKAWSVRAPALCLLATALLTVATAVTLANDFVHDITIGERAVAGTLPPEQAVGPAVLFGTTVFVAFAMLPITAEYVTGSVRSTFLAQPRRRVVLAAKTAVVGGSGLVVGIATGAVAVAGSRLVLGVHAAPSGTPGPLPLKVGVLLALDAVLVAGLASLLRSPVGTLAAGVVLTTATMALPDSLNAWTPAGAALRLLAGDAGQYPAGHAGAVALAVLVAWSAAVYATGAWLLERRDA
jgi:ABC-2 type transport system permease protein